jgi:hypothetical protein
MILVGSRETRSGDHFVVMKRNKDKLVLCDDDNRNKVLWDRIRGELLCLIDLQIHCWIPELVCLFQSSSIYMFHYYDIFGLGGLCSFC